MQEARTQYLLLTRYYPETKFKSEADKLMEKIDKDMIVTKKASKGKTQVSFSSTFTVSPYSYYKKGLTNSADIIDIEKVRRTQAIVGVEKVGESLP